MAASGLVDRWMDKLDPAGPDRYVPRGACAELFRRKDTELLLSGPAGTGKSRACLERLHQLMLRHPGARGLIVRKTAVSLASTALETYETHVVPTEMASGEIRFFGGSARKPAQYQYSNGSTINVGGLDKATKIMSSEYDVIYVQEAIELTEGDWEACTTRLRSGTVSREQLIADTNPDTPNHWLKQRADRGQTVLLESRHEDNPVYFDDDGQMTDAGRAYIDGILDQLTGVRYHRLRKGLWVAAEGVIYEDWDPAVHLVDRFEVPEEWPRFWVVDFGYCVDEETEILTDEGWKTLDEVRAGQQCLSISPATGLAEWETVEDVSIFPAQPRPMLEMTSQSHSSLTTPNHRWLCRYDRHDPTRLRFKTTDSFAGADMVPTAAPVVDLPIVPKFSDAFVELVAWYWTEGSRYNGRGSQLGGSISQNRGAHADRIRAALHRLYGPPSGTMRFGKAKSPQVAARRARVVELRAKGWTFRRIAGEVELPDAQAAWKDHRQGLVDRQAGGVPEREPRWRDWIARSNAKHGDERGDFHLNGPALRPILEWVHGHDKVVSSAFIVQLTQAQLELFIQTSIDADGWTNRDSGTLMISQAHRARLDSLQMACQLAGKASVRRHHTRGKSEWWTLTIFARYRQFQPANKRRWTVYDGRIWCPTTRNSTWLARRRGTVYFTGNTNPYAHQWWAQDPDGRLYLYREIYRTRRLVEDHARDALKLVTDGSGEWTEPRPEAVICDHDAEDRATLERHLGMPTVKAHKAVKVGLEAVMSRLRPAGDGRPRLFVVRDATVERDPDLVDAKKPASTAEEIPAYIWVPGADGKPVKEEPLKLDDHGVDCVRYMAAHVDLKGRAVIHNPTTATPTTERAGSRWGRRVQTGNPQIGRSR